MLETIAVVIGILAGLATIGKLLSEILSTPRGRIMILNISIIIFICIFLEYLFTSISCAAEEQLVFSNMHPTICLNPYFAYPFMSVPWRVGILIADSILCLFWIISMIKQMK